jgi:hypothetical protein
MATKGQLTIETVASSESHEKRKFLLSVVNANAELVRGIST